MDFEAEDLTTPEHLLHLPIRLDAEKIGAALAHEAAAFLRDPENLAAVAGATLLPVIVFRHRPPLLPWLAMALIGDRAGRMAWRTYANIETLARAADSE